MKYTINRDNIAVADELYWQPMDTCPLNVEVLLLSQGGVQTRGRVSVHNAAMWAGWMPFPRSR